MASPESEVIRKNIHKETAPSVLALSEQRQAWIDYAETVPVSKKVCLHEENVKGIPCLSLSRKDTPKDTTIIYVHGGGLIDGAIITHREFISRLVATTGHGATMIEYRLIPEHPFPAALEDVLNVYNYILDTSKIDSKRVVLGGDSSGGGLVISAMLKLREENKKLPCCAFTISGVFDMTLSAKSMVTRNQIDPCLSREALRDWLHYFDEGDLSNPYLSPLFGDTSELPPILIQAGDHEVWLDDSKRMADKINQSGGNAELRIWDSMWHAWPMYSDLPEAHEAIEEIGTFIDNHIES